MSAKDLRRVKTVADDVLLIGNGNSVKEAINDHDAKLKELLERYRRRGVKLNEQTSTTYIRHVLTSARIKAIRQDRSNHKDGKTLEC